jgi:murein DD-endopeptidase MepM/ murein hydrolase activator NlpD
MLLLVVACTADAPVPVPTSKGATDIFLPADTQITRGLVAPRSTLDMLLREVGVAADVAGRVVGAARRVFDPRRLRAAQPFLVERTPEGDIRHFSYEIDDDSFLSVAVTPGGEDLHAQILPIAKTIEQAVTMGEINAESPSLFAAMAAAGERADLSVALANVFGGEMDFNSDLQPGDQFVLSYERFVRDDRPAGYGAITAAEFQNDGRRIRALRFTVPGGKPDYYDEEGRSLRRFFLRSPLKFEPRVTSRYSRSRVHPVLQKVLAHRGVDYGAPAGAPVVAVSAGTVVSASYDPVNGRMVRLRHASGYDSFYLHLSAFSSGIVRGARVDQGRTIGLVGSSGLATGPHLHYGLQKNGAWVDPLREHRSMPPGDPIPEAAMNAFREVRDAALAELAAVKDSHIPPELRTATR